MKADHRHGPVDGRASARPPRGGLLACAALMLCAAGTVAATAPAIRLSDDAAGPSCYYYLGMGNMTWGRKGGDWVDRSGERYGARPFDTRVLPGGRQRLTASWNVTDLVTFALDKRVSEVGIMLRAIPEGRGQVIDFHSREVRDASLRPLLRITWADGEESALSPEADTYLDCTSYSSLGQRPHLRVSGSHSTWLAFKVLPASRRVAKAELHLTSDVRYGDGATVGVFGPDPAYGREPAAALPGIAANYSRDRHIARDSDVLFASDFEQAWWRLEWSGFALNWQASVTDSDVANRFEPLDGRALKVQFRQGKNHALDLRYDFARQGHAEPEHVFLRYYLRFGDDWNPSSDGGKLPGIAGTYGRAGWGMRRSDGFNGWSVRGAFAVRPAGLASVRGLTAIGSYAYHPDFDDSSGEHWPWSGGPGGVLENNRWYCIEQEVRLNTPGLKDGVFRAWVDGRLVAERGNVRFRIDPALRIENVWLNVYHGGVTPSPRDMSLYIDNVVIARRYIGPMRD